MSEYLITTDACADLPQEYLLENNIKCMPLYYNLDDVIYGDEENVEPHEFYEKMRKGAMPTTMACNPEYVENAFRTILEKGFDIIHIAFSSALSSSYNASVIAAKELEEEFPQRKIEVIDSKCASMGQGLLVYKLVNLKEEGKSFEEVVKWAYESLPHISHQFTVDDLHHLHRGGRVSKTTAVVGSLINVKPILHVNDEGKLLAISNVRGRKKAIQHLLQSMKETSVGYDNDIVFISHGDCREEAEKLAEMIKEETGIDKFMINYIGPTIGAHAGPGTIALFFMAEHR